MFDFAWSEIALIAAVALIAIGPKDMPVAIRAVTDMIKKARRMAAEFQTHVDEMVRDANLDEVRSSISDLRNFDIRGEIEKAVDPDHALRDTFASNPLEPTPSVTDTTATPVTAEAVEVGESVVAELERPADVAPEPEAPRAPAFIPPNMVPAAQPTARSEEAPAFIPPEVVQERRLRQSSDR